ncbi:hypothetical protein LIER_15881 [Lithospermum erythrorhizon]|uniref:Uncharacterized protein n=1 Tax=Lithospermum erythrorhizon TaxID=34254 RepID=A0AAV3Q7Q4_LITER
METSLFLKLFRWSFLVNGGTWRSLPEWWDYISTQMVKHGLEEDSGKVANNDIEANKKTTLQGTNRDINIEGSLWELRSAIWGRCKAHWLLKP